MIPQKIWVIWFDYKVSPVANIEPSCFHEQKNTIVLITIHYDELEETASLPNGGNSQKQNTE